MTQEEKKSSNAIAFTNDLKTKDLLEILGITIKHDNANKLTTFLCMLSIYTEDLQFNISFNAPSSTGKSYIPLEIAKLFPKEDIREISYSSPTAFFHENGKYDKEKNQIIVDLSKKVIVFLDQPNQELLGRLRSLLSHDKKEIEVKITDKSNKGGNKTKTVILIGYPAVIFCTANLSMNEQESSRFVLLSPEMDSLKIKDSIDEILLKEKDKHKYYKDIDNNNERNLLKERIAAIKEEDIKDVKIIDTESIKEGFMSNIKTGKSRHTRDIKKLISIIKMFTLLNMFNRERSGNNIIANEDDINEGLKLWKQINISQEYGVPPYIYSIYKKIILHLLEKEENSKGITRNQIIEYHYFLYQKPLSEWQLRNSIIPMLKSAGLIIEGPDQIDRRKLLIKLLKKNI